MKSRAIALLLATVATACVHRELRPVRGEGRACAGAPAPRAPAVQEAPPRQFVQSAHWGAVRRLAFSPDGRWLASAADDRSVRLWDVASRRELRILLTRGDVDGLVFGAAGQLVVARHGAFPTIVDPVAGRELAALGEGAIPERVDGAGGSSSWLAYSPYAHDLALYDALGNKLRDLERPCPDDPSSVAFAPGARAAAVLCDDDKGPLALLRAPASDHAARAEAKLPKGVARWGAIAPSPDGAFAVALDAPPDAALPGLDDEAMRALRAAIGREETPPHPPRMFILGESDPLEVTLPASTGAPSAIAVSPAGDRVAAMGARVAMWDARARKVVWSDVGDRPSALAFSPDGRWLAVGREDGSILLRDVATGRDAASFGASIRKATEIAFDGKDLVVRSRSAESRYALDRAERTKSAPPAAPSDEARVEEAMDRLGLARGALERGPAPAIDPGALVAGATAVARSADGATRFVGTADGDLAIVRAGAIVARGTSDGLTIERALVAPAGDVVATISLDGAVRVWDAKTAEMRAMIFEFEDDEWMIASPRGAYTGTSEVGDRIGWVFERPLEFFSFEQLASSFRDPEVVRRRLRGETVDAPTTVPRPPSAQIVRALPSRDASGKASVRVRVRSDARVDVVRAYVEGRLAASADVCAAGGEVDLEVPLMPGIDHVTAVAFDDRGFASNEASTELPAADRGLARPDVWVLAVGVSAYPHLLERVTSLAPADRAAALDNLQLPAATKDAEAIAARFASLAGPGRPYAAAHVATLTDDRATPAAVRDALARLAAMRPNDVAIVAFAGHGFKPSDAADMVFVTGEARLTPDGRGVTPETLRDAAVGWSDLATGLASARGRVMVLLDACHAGHIDQALAVPNAALADALVGSGRAGALVFAAAKGRQVSFEPRTARAFRLDLGRAPRVPAPPGGAEEPHGYFTAALLASLQDPETDKNGDGEVQASELVEEVTRRVSDATAQRQTPWLARREIFGDFALAPVAAARR